ncbi:MAG: lipid-A-disaccharide synthase N-terminal domain-containing protein [Verrucomicrobia bacterium]|nr:lipid-A-disaccharide synthase N-terminal domain-containing protein [Verrucomicrobiota bacterium]
MNSFCHWIGMADVFSQSHWDAWKAVGWLGNAVFFSRFIVQWYLTEKRRQVVIPSAFWWLSLAGALLLFVYGLHLGDWVFIFAYAFTWIPYVRNLVIHHRHKAAQQLCAACEATCVPTARFCHHCGTRLPQTQAG